MSAKLLHYKFFDNPTFFELIFNKEKCIIEKENKIKHNIDLYLKNTTLSIKSELKKLCMKVKIKQNR